MKSMADGLIIIFKEAPIKFFFNDVIIIDYYNLIIQGLGRGYVSRW